MSSISIVRDTPVVVTPRLLQMAGMFDVAIADKSRETWTPHIDLPETWNIGLIVGPSGSGKTTIATEIFGDAINKTWNWSVDKSILDDFPADMSIKEIIMLLSSVGFSSPPSWVRPFRVLSNGEQFRVTIARTLSEMSDLAVVDEFTSVVDRNVAQIGSAAVAKTVRRRNQKFVAVSCHYDIMEWLQPDWIYEPHLDKFYSGRYLQRPKIELEIYRVHRDAWRMFRKHHYLDTSIHVAAQCFVATWNKTPVAFASYLHFPHPKTPNMKREHRTVTLPDYQGVGIGNALSEFVAGRVVATGARYLSVTSHPAMIAHRARSSQWRMIAKPNNKTKSLPRQGLSRQGSGKSSKIGLRMRATFEYID